MSKVLNKISFFLVLALMIGLTLPNNTQAADTKDTTTDLITIHKITGNEELPGTWENLTGTKPENHNDGKPIPNIEFTYFKVEKAYYDQLMANMSDFDSVEKVSKLVGSNGKKTGPTNKDGEVTIPDLEEGFYYFVENGSTAVKTSNAVPFGLELPFTNKEGDGYLKDLHVWPKNTLEETPTIDQDIEEVGTDSPSFDIGDSFDWIIKPTTPKGIGEYEEYTVKYTLANTLTFDESKGITVKAGETTLDSDKDFNADYHEESRMVTVEFTKDDLKEIAKSDATELNIFVPTMINKEATMGAKITNTATLSFNNGHGVSGEVSVQETDIPSVFTGGKNFVIKNKDKDDDKLVDAQFKIKKKDGQYLIRDSETLNITWGDETKGTVFTSGDDGTFFVKGLAFGDYTIKEIKAPNGYTLPTNPETDFTVSVNSFYTDTSVSSDTAPTAEPLKITNKKTLLPKTGGAGTILFTVVGLVLMALGILLLRKRKEA